MMKPAIAKRDPDTREWIISIPMACWNEFYKYLQDARLDYKLGEIDPEAVRIIVPDGYKLNDLKDTVGVLLDGLTELQFQEGDVPHTRKAKKKTDLDIDINKPADLAVIAVKKRAAPCRFLDSDRIITLRSSGLWLLFPGAIATILPQKQWRYAGHSYLSGEIQSVRIDAKALNLIPLKLEDCMMWDPDEEYWGEEDVPLEKWAQQIIAHGPRPLFEMEQVLPGMDPDNPFDDPIGRSVDLKNSGDHAGAREVLMELCRADLRCLDAHAHLGNCVFDRDPGNAIHHYEIGVRIGELSLGKDFPGVLLWGLIDNRPFLRCMQGYGLCLWRLERFDEAVEVFQRMLWLNPSDNQGIRFLINDVKKKNLWEDRE